MAADTLVKTIIIAASKEVVWAYLTEGEKLGTWFNPSKADLKAGENYELSVGGTDSDTACYGTVLEMTLHTHLKMSFSIRPMMEQVNMLTWTLSDVDGGTKLTLVHEGLGAAGFGMLSGIDAGWDKHFAALREKASA